MVSLQVKSTTLELELSMRKETLNGQALLKLLVKLYLIHLLLLERSMRRVLQLQCTLNGIKYQTLLYLSLVTDSSWTLETMETTNLFTMASDIQESLTSLQEI